MTTTIAIATVGPNVFTRGLKAKKAVEAMRAGLNVLIWQGMRRRWTCCTSSFCRSERQYSIARKASEESETIRAPLAGSDRMNSLTVRGILNPADRRAIGGVLEGSINRRGARML
jgi:hypothetical protein